MLAPVLAIDALPTLRLVEALERPPAFEAERQRQTELLETSEFAFNGPIYFVSDYSAAEISVYPSRYAEKLAFTELGGEGCGALSVALILVNGQGETGWQLRSERVLQPGFHHFSVGGGVTELDLQRGLLAELEEELGLDESDIAGLRPIAIGAFPDSLVVFFAAELAADAKLSFDEAEVAGFVWSDDPVGELNLPASCATRWPALERCLWRSLAVAA